MILVDVRTCRKLLWTVLNDLACLDVSLHELRELLAVWHLGCEKHLDKLLCPCEQLSSLVSSCVFYLFNPEFSVIWTYSVNRFNSSSKDAGLNPVKGGWKVKLTKGLALGLVHVNFYSSDLSVLLELPQIKFVSKK